MGDWNEFNVALVGATAALAGLVIVAASVNIGEIVKAPALTARLGTAISGLVLALVICALGLAPGLPAGVHGVAASVGALIAAAFAVDATRRILADRDPLNRLRSLKSGLGFLVPATYAIGGVLLLTGLPDAGLVALAIGALTSIAVALMISWIVLVEVLR
ncbi:hypothetical protein [Microbacterium sp. VKM Ac-2923]|uniref:hypothetical protein n=1 Tax=Microbacterium sp. VKM Ac-2923 TaxID=2929476 RepID=UPI001FB21F33|nr:hypothetical protein [Microbacterium sp. VKM Ac-2923]MCJ1707288.1 hypothetical protein [Microbacterium sp. VKM Ac-2923]